MLKKCFQESFGIHSSRQEPRAENLQGLYSVKSFCSSANPLPKGLTRWETAQGEKRAAELTAVSLPRAVAADASQKADGTRSFVPNLAFHESVPTRTVSMVFLWKSLLLTPALRSICCDRNQKIPTLILFLIFLL